MSSRVAKSAPTAVLVILLSIAATLPAGAAIVLTDGTPSADKGKQPPPATLVTPARSENSRQHDEANRCMTVCARWGQECTSSESGPGGQTRKCRRACQQFTEECF